MSRIPFANHNRGLKSHPGALGMVKIACVLLSVIVVLMVGGSSVLAYDPPTANHTDVILWYGDNLTIERLTISDLEDALTAAAEAQADIIVEAQEDIADKYLLLLIVAAILALVFWQRNLFLYTLAVPVAMVYGLSLAITADNGSPLWVAGIIIAIIGTYCLFKVATLGLGLGRSKERTK